MEDQDNNNQGAVKTTRDFKMNGDWNKQASALRTKYPLLTSDDVTFETGKEKELLKRLESRLGKSQDEVIDILTNNYKDVSH
ncbi:hypothetical protein LX77_03409 [Gelidibacter algens]|uniref:General stress protein CsbD n=1 Tax=Gelidibacter algens TaxID=49280 RepID=A0A1A7R181_9FLAO|nr:hypothetical protein [Gelidibacter algens]OBX24537.1 hypothetical protein A9996_14775 [Gelidibacter algens]RAJ19779.1 hypothetical protein LX77_03409 [Gelidibacter algens]